MQAERGTRLPFGLLRGDQCVPERLHRLGPRLRGLDVLAFLFSDLIEELDPDLERLDRDAESAAERERGDESRHLARGALRADAKLRDLRGHKASKPALAALLARELAQLVGEVLDGFGCLFGDTSDVLDGLADRLGRGLGLARRVPHPLDKAADVSGNFYADLVFGAHRTPRPNRAAICSKIRACAAVSSTLITFGLAGGTTCGRRERTTGFTPR